MIDFIYLLSKKREKKRGKKEGDLKKGTPPFLCAQRHRSLRIIDLSGSKNRHLQQKLFAAKLFVAKLFA